MTNHQTVAILKSLADETRLSIVRRLAENSCEIQSGDIVSTCARLHELSQPTMSHHFAKLVQSGVISERKSGTEKFYRLNKQLLDATGIDVLKL